MKRILVIQGGGRSNGNTAQLVESFIQGAEDAGHSVERISLLKNEVKGCLGCNACRYGKPCIQKDSFNDIVPEIKSADCIMYVDKGGILERGTHEELLRQKGAYYELYMSQYDFLTQDPAKENTELRLKTV